MKLLKLRKLIASVLLLTNASQVALAAISPDLKPLQEKQTQAKNLPSQKSIYEAPAFEQTNYPYNYPYANRVPQNLVLSTTQMGINGPINGGLTYSKLTGVYFNGQFLQKISDALAVGVLGEYGSKQYRLNGTIGLFLAARTFVKISAEQLGQTLPFMFATGGLDERVKQNAVGARLQREFDFANLSIGGYGAKAPNKRLVPLSFISSGYNCGGFTCINDRNIAGATSGGGDLGAGAFLTPVTYLEGRFYYDRVRYNTIFSSTSIYNKDGLGGGLYGQQLLAPNVKLSGFAELRKIYDTYNVSLSWLPGFIQSARTEFALTAQRVVSHNQTPNNNMIGIKVTLLADRPNYQAPMYGLSQMPLVDNIASWVSQPAVKMNQVLALAEERVYLADTLINSVSPNAGPLAGGNTITLTGRNFLPGALVKFGGSIATITEMTNSSMTVIVPPGIQPGAVSISITTPDGKVASYENAYLYTKKVALVRTLR